MVQSVPKAEPARFLESIDAILTVLSVLDNNNRNHCLTVSVVRNSVNKCRFMVRKLPLRSTADLAMLGYPLLRYSSQPLLMQILQSCSQTIDGPDSELASVPVTVDGVHIDDFSTRLVDVRNSTPIIGLYVYMLI